MSEVNIEGYTNSAAGHRDPPSFTVNENINISFNRIVRIGRAYGWFLTLIPVTKSP